MSQQQCNIDPADVGGQYLSIHPVENVEINKRPGYFRLGMEMV